MAAAKRPLADRFWEKVHKTDGCWFWTAGVDKDGYGQIWVDKAMRRARATRVAWFLYYGVWPEALMLHRCDTPQCVRKEHLFEGVRGHGRVQYWLAELDRYGNPTLIDGMHSKPAGPKKAEEIIRSLSQQYKGRQFAYAKVILTPSPHNPPINR